MDIFTKTALTLSMGLASVLPVAAQTVSSAQHLDKDAQKAIEKVFKASGVKAAFIGMEQPLNNSYAMTQYDAAHFQSVVPNKDGSTSTADYWAAFDDRNKNGIAELSETKGLYVEITNSDTRAGLRGQTSFSQWNINEVPNYNKFERVDFKALYDGEGIKAKIVEATAFSFAGTMSFLEKCGAATGDFRQMANTVTEKAKVPLAEKSALRFR